MLDIMLNISISMVALVMLLGLLFGLDIIPGENWVGTLGVTVILVECMFCFVYACKFAPSASVASSNAMAIKLAVMLVFGIVLVIAGEVLQSRRIKRNRARIEKIVADIKKRQDQFNK